MGSEVNAADELSNQLRIDNYQNLVALHRRYHEWEPNLRDPDNPSVSRDLRDVHCEALGLIDEGDVEFNGKVERLGYVAAEVAEPEELDVPFIKQLFVFIINWLL